MEENLFTDTNSSSDNVIANDTSNFTAVTSSDSVTEEHGQEK